MWDKNIQTEFIKLILTANLDRMPTWWRSQLEERQDCNLQQSPKVDQRCWEKGDEREVILAH